MSKNGLMDIFSPKSRKTLNEGGNPAYYNKRTRTVLERRFDLASNVVTVIGQDWENYNPNSELTKKDEVRIVEVVVSEIGERLKDSIKKFIFKENITVQLGMKFRYNDTIWIAGNPNNFPGTMNECVALRCNNLLRKYANGVLQKEPVYIGKLSPNATRSFFGTDNTFQAPLIPQIYCQANNFTLGIKVDDRFIFGLGSAGSVECYKVTAKLLTSLASIDDEASFRFGTISVEGTNIDPERDDVERGIANAYEMPSQAFESCGHYIRISPEFNSVYEGEPKTYIAKMYYGANPVDADVILTAGGSARTDRYVFIVDGNKFTVSVIKEDVYALTVKAIAETPNGETITAEKDIWLRT